VYQLHKPAIQNRRNLKYTIAFKPYQTVQIDLLDYQKFASQNNRMNYILIGVDVFSRKAFASYIQNKTPVSVLKGFKTWEISPELLYHDSGNEFKGEFDRYLTSKHIQSVNCDVGDHNALGVIDRFSRTIKTMISKYMTFHNTTTIYKVLPSLVEAYNNTPHSALGNVSPNSVFINPSNFLFVLEINQEKYQFNQSLTSKQLRTIHVGDKVRIMIPKPLFEKGYTMTYSKYSFEVVSIFGEKALLSNHKEYPPKQL